MLTEAHSSQAGTKVLISMWLLQRKHIVSIRKHVVIVGKHCVVSYKKMHMDPTNKHLVMMKASRYYIEMLLLHEHPAIMKKA